MFSNTVADGNFKSADHFFKAAVCFRGDPVGVCVSNFTLRDSAGSVCAVAFHVRGPADGTGKVADDVCEDADRIRGDADGVCRDAYRLSQIKNEAATVESLGNRF